MHFTCTWGRAKIKANTIMFINILVISALTKHITANPEESRIHIKMLESGDENMKDAGDLLLDVFHVVLQQSEKGLIEWSALKNAQNGKHPQTAMLFKKKYLGSEFLGKRNLGSEFLGKRAFGILTKRGKPANNV